VSLLIHFAKAPEPAGGPHDSRRHPSSGDVGRSCPGFTGQDRRGVAVQTVL